MADKSLLNILRIRAVDEEVWRTINNAKVLIDGDDGTIKGGMGGKWNGKKFKPSWGKNLKTGKKVLKPWKGKFTHFQGTKKDLLEKLKKAAEPPKVKKHFSEVWKEYNKLYIKETELASANTMEQLEQAYKEWKDQFEEYKKTYADLDTDAMNHDIATNSVAEYVLGQNGHLEEIEKGVNYDYEDAKEKVKTKECTQKAKDAWVKVVKAKNALKDAKSLKAKLGNQKKMADAWSEYYQAVQESPGEIAFKPKTKIVTDIINMQSDELATFGHKKKGEAVASQAPGQKGYEDPGKVDPFITPKTDKTANRQANIQNTIAALKKLSEAAAGYKSKYQPTMMGHQGAEGWKKNKLPGKAEDMDVHKKLVGETSKVWKDATPDEKKSIIKYTGAFSQFNEPLRGIEYGSSKFVGVGKIDMDNVGVNQYGGYKMSKGQAKKQINEMTDIIDKSSYNFDMQVRRGVSESGAAKLLGIDESMLNEWSGASEEDVRNAVEGKLVTEFGFCSTGVADGKGFSHQPIELRILCPAGTKMMYAEPFSHYGHGSHGKDWDGVDKQTTTGSEQEMILQRNTRFQVQRAEKKNGRWHFYLQVVAQDPVQFA